MREVDSAGEMDAREPGSGAVESVGGAGGAAVDGGDLGELMHAAFRQLRRRWSEQLAPLDLTPHQSRALFAVEQGGCSHPAPCGHSHHGGPGERGDDGAGVRLKDLAARLRIAPRSATEVVDQLADKGLVERTPDPSDRRATRIVLTEAGVELRRQVTQVRRREAGDFFAVLDSEDQTELARLLGLLSGRD